MAIRNPGLTKAYDVGAQVGAYLIVKFGASDGLVATASAATDLLIGVSSELATEVGERCDVFHGGIAPVIYGGNVTRGQLLTADSAGRAIAATTSGQRVIGAAVVSGAVGDRGSVLIAPSIFYTA